MDDDLQAIAEKLVAVLEDHQDHPWRHLIGLQNAVDFLEMLAGRKPVYAIWGYGPDFWVETIGDLSNVRCLISIETKPWGYHGDYEIVAQWPVEMIKNLVEPSPISCFSIDPAVIDKIATVETIDHEEESRLLGYPLCCVEEFHQRHMMLLNAVPELFESASENSGMDVEQLISENILIPINYGIAEIWKNGNPGPFCSFSCCDACSARSDSPGQLANRRRMDFIRQLSPELLKKMRRAIGDVQQSGVFGRHYVKHLDENGISWDHITRVVSRPAF